MCFRLTHFFRPFTLLYLFFINSSILLIFVKLVELLIHIQHLSFLKCFHDQLFMIQFEPILRWYVEQSWAKLMGRFKASRFLLDWGEYSKVHFIQFSIFYLKSHLFVKCSKVVIFVNNLQLLLSPLYFKHLIYEYYPKIHPSLIYFILRLSLVPPLL